MTPEAAIALKYDNLHRALSSGSAFDPETERTHIRSLVKKIIPSLLAESESSSLFISVVVREILVNNILFPLVNMIADPDYLNQTIEVFVSSFHHANTLNPIFDHQ